jgi:hypothetical protein
MNAFVEYVRELFHEWWAIGGALSLIAFFIPRLNDYPAFIVVVAVLAFMMAGYRLHRKQIRSRNDQVSTLRQQHADEIAGIKRQHEAAVAQRDNRVSELEAEIAELRRPKFTEEIRQIAERAYKDLKREERIVLRYMVAAGDMTDRQALQHLQTKGMATNWGSVFSRLSLETPFVQRVLQGRQYAEHVKGYEGNYTLNPRFRDVLEVLIEGDPASLA